MTVNDTLDLPADDVMQTDDRWIGAAIVEAGAARPHCGFGLEAQFEKHS